MNVFPGNGDLRRQGTLWNSPEKTATFQDLDVFIKNSQELYVVYHIGVIYMDILVYVAYTHIQITYVNVKIRIPNRNFDEIAVKQVGLLVVFQAGKPWY